MSYVKKISISLIKASLIQPFRTALGEHKNLENILFALELNDGTKGFGEAAIATHITGETLSGTLKNLKSAGERLIGRGISDYLKISFELNERLAGNKSAVAAAETALMDALTKSRRIPLWRFFGSKPVLLKTDITIVISTLAETERAAKKFYKQGFRAFKVKIGRNQDLDLKRVLAVKKLAPNSKIYLDANQGYSADETLKFLKSLKRAGVTPHLIEQPVAKSDWEGLKRVTRAVNIAVCADESAACLSDVSRIIREKAAGAVNIKLMKFGLFQAREAALLAKANGLKLMIGGMMESSLAMTAAAHLAAGLGFFDYVDLDTPFFIKKGFDKNPYLHSRGVYDLRNVKSGIGIIPS